MKNNRKTIIISAFLLLCLIQLAIPISMIYEKEVIVQEGNTYKFRTRPIDPYDPFRGKYITLSFRQRGLKVSNFNEWKSRDVGFFPIAKDEQGFAIVKSPLLNKPKSGDYLELKVHTTNWNDSTLYYKLPFTRFYMNEEEALNAELEYRKVNRDRKKENAYAVVKINEGEAVLEDVIIGGISAKDLK